MARDRNPNPGAVSLGERDGGRKKGGAWWKWLLAALLLIGAIILLAALLGGDDEPSTAGQTSPATRTTPADDSTADSAAPSAAGGGTLTAGEASLLPVPEDVGQYVGQDAEGQGVEVQSVVGNEGFWVGTSQTDRVYVEYGGDVGEDEARFRPEVGDVVDLDGPVRPAPEDPAQTLNLEDADAEQVRTQGAYVNAETVEEAG